MNFLKLIHVLAVFIWVGNLMCLTRFMGYHVKQNEETQKSLAKLYQRMRNFIGIPCMCLAVLTGVFLIQKLDSATSLGWLHMKLTFFLALVVCEWVCGRLIHALNENLDQSRGIKYKILHGLTGLFLIGLLSSAIIVRDKDQELTIRVEKEISERQMKSLSKIKAPMYDTPLSVIHLERFSKNGTKV